MHTAKLNDSEIAERVAVLKRFRSLLEQQRLKFREYLTVLENKKKVFPMRIPMLSYSTRNWKNLLLPKYLLFKSNRSAGIYVYQYLQNEHSDIPHLKTDLDDLQNEFWLRIRETVSSCKRILPVYGSK